MKTLHDYYAHMLAAFTDAMMDGKITSVDMAVLSVMLLYEGRM